jgi:hypothetical protein
LTLENVEMINCGTADTERGCLLFENLKLNANRKSIVKGSSIHTGNSMGLVIKNSHHITIEDNIFHGFKESSVKISLTSFFKFSNNILSKADKRDVASASPPLNVAFSLLSQGSDLVNVTITDNKVYGYIESGFMVPGMKCDLAQTELA